MSDKGAGIIVVIVCAMIAVASIIYKKHLRSLPQRYVIGTVTRIWKSPTGGYTVKYFYELNSKKFENTANIGEGAEKIQRDQRYLIAVPEGHEDKGVILLKCMVDDAIEAPEEGWRAWPNFCQR